MLAMHAGLFFTYQTWTGNCGDNKVKFALKNEIVLEMAKSRTHRVYPREKQIMNEMIELQY